MDALEVFFGGVLVTEDLVVHCAGVGGGGDEALEHYEVGTEQHVSRHLMCLRSTGEGRVRTYSTEIDTFG